MIFVINKRALVIVILLLILLIYTLVKSSTASHQETPVAHTDNSPLCTTDKTHKPTLVTTLDEVTISTVSTYFWQDRMPSIATDHKLGTAKDVPLLASLELHLNNTHNETKEVTLAVVLCDKAEKIIPADFFIQQKDANATHPVMTVPLNAKEHKTIQLVSNNGIYQQTQQNHTLYAMLIIVIEKQQVVIRLPDSHVQQIE